MRAVRKLFPVTDDYHDTHWFVRDERQRYATPLFLCLAAIVFADIAFAVDSIPAAFGITRDPFLIWMGERVRAARPAGPVRAGRGPDHSASATSTRRSRSSSRVVAVKLMLEDVYKLPAEASLALVLALLTGGIVASMIADRRDAGAAS